MQFGDVSQMVPMPAHEETDRTLAYSALMKYEMKDENGNPAPFVAVVTATMRGVRRRSPILGGYLMSTQTVGRFVSPDGAARWTKGLLLATMVLSIVAIGSGLLQIEQLSRAASGGISDAEAQH
jgi:hypothetical protein